jgi:hypothetical protein
MALQVLLGGDSLNQGYQKINYNFEQFTQIGGVLYANLNVLGDVQIANPQNNHVLVFDDASDIWKNGSLPVPSIALNDISDVTITNVQHFQSLFYNVATGNFINGYITLNGLNDVEITNLADNQFIQYNASNSQWENVTLPDYELMIQQAKILSLMGVM